MSSIAFSPNPKNTDYNLRQCTNNPTLPMDVNAVMKQNFVYRMVFKDICWFLADRRPTNGRAYNATVLRLSS